MALQFEEDRNGATLGNPNANGFVLKQNEAQIFISCIFFGIPSKNETKTETETTIFWDFPKKTVLIRIPFLLHLQVDVGYWPQIFKNIYAVFSQHFGLILRQKLSSRT